ncbi:MAG: ATP-binding protein [Candidatus Binatia bacterium]
MDALQTESSASSLARGLDRFFGGIRTATAIQLRWPLVVVCSYLLLYAPAGWLAPTQTHAILIFYLLTNATLYFVAYGRFDSRYFYGALLLFDTALLTLGLTMSAVWTPDFYLACFCTLILGCICNDSRGLLAVTFLAPALYGYVVFTTGATDPPTFYLRLAVPFVISLFYGYFAQVERLRRPAAEREELAAREQKLADALRTQREHLKALRDVKLGLTSTVDVMRTLDGFLENALAHLPYSAAVIRLRNPESGVMQTGAAKGIGFDKAEQIAKVYDLVDKVATLKQPLVIPELFSVPRVDSPDLLREQKSISFACVPLIAGGEVLGSLAFLARQELGCAEEEIEFLSTVAAEAAIGIQHSQLFQHIHEQASELRDANKVKDEFLGVVSRELRSPLNVISGYTNMLMERMLGEITPIQEKALQTMLRQAKDLHAMIDSVLQVSCLEAESVEPELHETNFWEFLYEIKSHYDYPLPNDVKLAWNFSSDLPTLMADRGKLRQILHNLINNALKFTNQGTVTVSAQYLHGKRYMEFKIADTGIGISKEELPHIFEKFRQLDRSGARAYGGVGLGLYIVKRCTEILHGTIHVESKPARGSIFTLRVPSHTRKVTEPAPSRVAAVG